MTRTGPDLGPDPAPRPHSERPKTIASNGQVVTKPYGLGRWHSPRRYGCAHAECSNAATVLVSAQGHEVDGVARAHNCCAQH